MRKIFIINVKFQNVFKLSFRILTVQCFIVTKMIMPHSENKTYATFEPDVTCFQGSRDVNYLLPKFYIKGYIKRSTAAGKRLINLRFCNWPIITTERVKAAGC